MELVEYNKQTVVKFEEPVCLKNLTKSIKNKIFALMG